MTAIDLAALDADAREARRTRPFTRINAAVPIDGICARDGALRGDETDRRVSARQGVIGRVPGTRVPVAESGSPGLTAGYGSVIALPIHLGGELAHIVARYV